MLRSGELVSGEFVRRFLTTGFAILDIPGDDFDQFNDAFRAAAGFFAAPLREKLTAQLPLESGYRPYGVEFSKTPGQPDEMESFSVTRRLPDGSQLLSLDVAESLRVKMLALFDILEPMVEFLIVQVASHLTGEATTERFHDSFRNWSLLQLNHSRPATTSAGYINELHEDGCLMTVMTVTGPGLELKVSDASFVPIQPTGKLLFISGEILNLLSGGSIPAIYHRVRTTGGIPDRMSLLFFADMNPNLCVPWISNEVNRGVDIGKRVLTNSTRYGLSEWELEQK